MNHGVYINDQNPLKMIQSSNRIHKLNTTTSQAGSYSLLFSLGLNIDGESYDRNKALC